MADSHDQPRDAIGAPAPPVSPPKPKDRRTEATAANGGAPDDATQPGILAALTALILLGALVIGLIVSLRLLRMPASATELSTYLQVMYPVLAGATLTSTASRLGHDVLNRFGIKPQAHIFFQFGGACLLLAVATALLVSMPARARQLNYDGTVDREHGQTFRALAAFQQASAFDPDNASVFYNLGNVYEDLNRPDDAIAAYERALELTAARAASGSPALPATWYAATNNLARLLILSEEPDKINRALEMLTAAVYSQPPADVQAPLYRNLALSEIELHLYGEAQNTLAYAQKLEPASHTTACVAALFHEAPENPFADAAAVQISWQQCLSATPEDRVPARWLAIARERIRGTS